jgi:hypothetical protein
MGSSGGNLTSRRRSASVELSTATRRDRNTGSTNDLGNRTVRLEPSVPKRDSSPVKMQGDKWRVVGGGVMLGTSKLLAYLDFALQLNSQTKLFRSLRIKRDSLDRGGRGSIYRDRYQIPMVNNKLPHQCVLRIRVDLTLCAHLYR